MDEPNSHNAVCATQEVNLRIAQTKHKSLINRRRILVAAIFILAALWGIRCAFIIDRRIDLLLSVAMSICTTWFCITDSHIRGRPLLHSYYWLIFITWSISVPIYLAFSRDFKKIWRIALYIFAWVATVFITCLATYLLVYGQTW